MIQAPLKKMTIENILSELQKLFQSSGRLKIHYKPMFFQMLIGSGDVAQRETLLEGPPIAAVSL